MEAEADYNHVGSFSILRPRRGSIFWSRYREIEQSLYF